MRCFRAIPCAIALASMLPAAIFADGGARPIALVSARVELAEEPRLTTKRSALVTYVPRELNIPAPPDISSLLPAAAPAAAAPPSATPAPATSPRTPAMTAKKMPTPNKSSVVTLQPEPLIVPEQLAPQPPAPKLAELAAQPPAPTPAMPPVPQPLPATPHPPAPPATAPPPTVKQPAPLIPEPPPSATPRAPQPPAPMPPAAAPEAPLERIPSPAPEPESGVAKTPVYDPQFKSLDTITTDTAPPLERDKQGKPLPLPDNVAVSYLRRQTELAQLPAPHEPWHGYVDQQLELQFCYRPLYFEQPQAERYGLTYGLLQPAVSAAHFFGTTMIMPLKMLRERPNDCTLFLYPDLPGDPPLRQVRQR